MLGPEWEANRLARAEPLIRRLGRRARVHRPPDHQQEARVGLCSVRLGSWRRKHVNGVRADLLDGEIRPLEVLPQLVEQARIAKANTHLGPQARYSVSPW